MSLYSTKGCLQAINCCMQERELRQYSESLTSRYVELQHAIQKVSHEITTSLSAYAMLDKGLYRGFSLVNTLMDDVSLQSCISNDLRRELQNFSHNITKVQSDLEISEKDLRIAQKIEEHIGKQLATYNRRLVEQVSTNTQNKQDALVLQNILHRSYDQQSKISALVESAEIGMSMQAKAAQTRAKDLYSLVMSLTHVLSLIEGSHDPAEDRWAKRGHVCHQAFAMKCCILPTLRCFEPVSLGTKEWRNKTLEDIHQMEEAIRILNSYQNLSIQRMYLDKALDGVLAEERVLLSELDASRACLMSKEKEVRQAFVQEDLTSIKAKKCAKSMFKNMQKITQEIEDHISGQHEEQDALAVLKKREAWLQQHKVHLMRALREIRHAQTKRHKSKKNDARNQGNVSLHKSNTKTPFLRKDCHSATTGMNLKALEYSVRRDVYQLIVESISEFLK